MKKFALLLSFAFIGIQTFAQEIYQSKAMNVSFFSTTAMEDIDAKTANATSVISSAKNDILIMIQVKSFTFKSSLMQEHFNENYMESDKFPDAKFIGKINESVDWKKEGTYNVTVTGKLNMHGVDKDRTIPGTITIKGNNVSVNSQFDVLCKDHNIKIPSVLSEKVAELVNVKVSGTYNLYVRPEKK
jgi:polyisoprenoid-binding protein YceI